MASGTIYGTTSNQNIEAKVVWSSEMDIASNSSRVEARLYYRRIKDDGYWTYGGGYFYVDIGDTTGGGYKDIAIKSDWVEAASGATTVTHGSDGKKSITIRARGEINGTTLTATYLSATVTLDTIPKSTLVDSLSCSTTDLTGTVTYKYTPRSSWYAKANISLNLNGNYIGIRSILHGKKTAGVQQTQSVVFSASELSAIYNNLPNATKGAIRVTIRTYYDADYSQEATDPTHKEISLNIPAAIKPTASLAVTLINNNAWIKGKGIYVAGYSGATCTMTAKPGEGASLSSTTITTPDNITYEAVKLNVERIKKSGSLTFTAKATDSRNRSASASKIITVLPYSAPTLSDFSAGRGTYNSGWTASDDGPDVKVSFKTTLSLADNGNVYSAAFKLDGAAVTPAAGVATGLASETTCTVYIKNVDAEISHSLKITTTDAIGNSTSVSITIPTKNITIEFNASGKGIAFGKPSEKDAFECAMDADIIGTLSVVSEITGRGYRVPEIQSGTIKITPSAANTPTSARVTFPKEFSGVPTVIVSPVGSIVGTTILGAGVTAYTAKDCLLWVTRTNTSETTLNWIAIY